MSYCDDCINKWELQLKSIQPKIRCKLDLNINCDDVIGCNIKQEIEIDLYGGKLYIKTD